MKITGGCLCGAVRFESADPPLVARICWCRLCQYLGAGSGTVNACFHTDHFIIQGHTQDYTSFADSGNLMHRRFCPVCGTPLFSSAEARPHLIFVRAGALDDPEMARPAMSIWTAQAPSWGCIASDIPRVERQPPPPVPSP
jgi:hypothetical protein